MTGRRLRWIVIAAVVLASAVYVTFRIRGAFTPEGRGARLVKSLERTLVVRRSCDTNETLVDPSAWNTMPEHRQQQAAEALAVWCAAQGGDGRMMIVDANSRRKVAQWADGALQKF